ncbi:MAG: hypothetical protein HQM16_18295, partial [Deltaproteobacteria bacterium]|nr:hypothetical protein [Deltaproteobacteria bacterium]
MPTLQVTTLFSNMRYADEFPIHSGKTSGIGWVDWEGRKVLSDANKRLNEHLKNNGPELLAGESPKDLVLALDKAMEEDAIENLSEHDPLSNYDRIGSKIEELRGGKTPKTSVYVEALVGNLTTLESIEQMFEALELLPENSRHAIFTLILAETSPDQTLRDGATILLRSVEDAASKRLKKDAQPYFSVLVRLKNLGMKPASPESVRQLLEQQRDHSIEGLRKGEITFEKFVKDELKDLYNFAFNFGTDIFGSFIETDPVMQSAVSFIYPEEVFDPMKTTPYYPDYEIPLTAAEIRSRAAACFGEARLAEIERAFEASHKNMAATRKSFSDVRINDPFAHFLFPLIISLPAGAKFGSLREAVDHYLDNNLNPPSLNYVRRILKIVGSKMTGGELHSYVQNLRSKIGDQIRRRARLYLGREATPAEIKEMAMAWPPTFPVYVRNGDWNKAQGRWGANSQKTLNFLSDMLTLGTRENRADDGIDHADLNLPANHRKRRDKIESERSHLDDARALEENYDLEVQLGDTSGNSVDWSSNYAWLLLSET